MVKKYGIGVISTSCGVMPQTLRAWEQRYGVFSPERSDGGQRLYSESDLKKAKYLATLIEQGHSISSLSEYSLDELNDMVAKLREGEAKYRSAVNTKKLMHYLDQFNVDGVVGELQHLRMSFGVKEFIFNVVLPTLREIGVMYTKGRYSVTQEHVVSALLRNQLSQIYLPNWQSNKSIVALATPEGNIHELPIIIADVLCRANRVTTRFLGAAHPAGSLASAMNSLKCTTLVLGATSSEGWDYKTNIIPYLEEMDKVLEKRITVILGAGTEMKFPKFAMIESATAMNSFEVFDKFLQDFL